MIILILVSTSLVAGCVSPQDSQETTFKVYDCIQFEDEEEYSEMTLNIKKDIDQETAFEIFKQETAFEIFKQAYITIFGPRIGEEKAIENINSRLKIEDVFKINDGEEWFWRMGFGDDDPPYAMTSWEISGNEVRRHCV